MRSARGPAGRWSVNTDRRELFGPAAACSKPDVRQRPGCGPAFHRRVFVHDVGFLLVVLVAALAAGCGGSEEGPVRAAVRGQVSLDGQPLESGMIRFVPAEGTTGPAAVAAIVDGHFELTDEEGPIVGDHRVEIEATDYTAFAIDDEQAFAKSFRENRGKPLPPNPVPETYNRRSTLTASISADQSNELSFPLTSNKTANNRR